MASMRVHELAKEFDMSSGDLLDRLKEMKIPAKSHASMLNDAYVDKIRKNLEPEIRARAGALEAEEAAALAAEQEEAERKRAEEEAERKAAEEAAKAEAEEKARQEAAAAEAAAEAQAQAEAQAEDTNGYTVYITKTGEKYHSGGCRYLKKSKIAIDINDARAQGYEPCSVCNP